MLPTIINAQSARMGNGKVRWKIWCSDCGTLEKPQTFYEPEDPRIVEVRDKHRAWHKEIDE